jgi:hypothetical protein
LPTGTADPWDAKQKKKLQYDEFVPYFNLQNNYTTSKKK